jgi:imidazoleglycerol-phosphate dehydratase
VPTKKTPAKKAAKVAVKRPATKRPPAAKRATAKGAPGSGVAPRAARIRRQTKEVDVTVVLKLDETGIPFFDHMLEQLGKHAGFDLEIKAVGDLAVDAHHTVEDTGIAVGEAVQQALGDKAGIARFGAALVPLDEALVQVALDLSARPFLVHEVDAKAKMIGVYDTRLTEEFVRAFCQAAGATIHVRQLAGRQPHHIVEAEFKALARALGDATRPGRTAGVPSTKGTL